MKRNPVDSSTSQIFSSTVLEKNKNFKYSSIFKYTYFFPVHSSTFQYIQVRVATLGYHVKTKNRDSTDTGIYQLQRITFNKQSYLIFYDTGCSNFVVRDVAIKRLGDDAKLQFNGPVNIGGVGNVTTESSGIYSVKLPLADEGDAVLTGPSLPKITNTFPQYPLDDAAKDVQRVYEKGGGNAFDLPSLPSSIGGDVDLMIGIKYLRYPPEPIFKLPSGLTIYKSAFKNMMELVESLEDPIKSSARSNNTDYVRQLSLLINYEFTWLLGYKDESNINESYVKRETEFKIAEEVGSDVTYRCIKCRSCSNCKDHDTTQSISFHEEVEQQIINKSVNVDASKNINMATLPFTKDPKLKLKPNRWKTMKVYEQQTKRLNKHPNDKEDIIKSERKLQELGRVDFVRNLPRHSPDSLKSHEIQNFIPWPSGKRQKESKSWCSLYNYIQSNIPRNNPSSPRTCNYPTKG